MHLAPGWNVKMFVRSEVADEQLAPRHGRERSASCAAFRERRRDGQSDLPPGGKVKGHEEHESGYRARTGL
jgi:hypothetical protein